MKLFAQSYDIVAISNHISTLRAELGVSVLICIKLETRDIELLTSPGSVHVGFDAGPPERLSKSQSWLPRFKKLDAAAQDYHQTRVARVRLL